MEQVIANGLYLGAQYALIALGLTLIFALMNVLNFAHGQMYVLGRLCVKLIFWASETSLFQSRLAHAGYLATPAPIWPDSPTAEALRPASPNS